jgi:hypothetical protein
LRLVYLCADLNVIHGCGDRPFSPVTTTMCVPADYD